MNSNWTIKNNPIEILSTAFKNLYPDIKYNAYFDQNLNQYTNETEKIYGFTSFNENEDITIFIDIALCLYDAVEIFAHELAHVAVGANHNHDEIWMKAFDNIYNEYIKVGSELFPEMKEVISDDISSSN